MRMKPMTRWIFLAWLCGTAAAAALDITNAAGRVYSNATVRRVESGGFVIATSKGVTKIPFTELAPETQRQFGHDPSAPIPVEPPAPESRLTHAGNETWLAPVNPEAVRELRKKGFTLTGKATKAVDGGLLMSEAQRIMADGESGTAAVSSEEMVPFFDCVPLAGEGEFVCVLGATTLSLGMPWKGRVVPCSRPFLYRPSAGPLKPVRCYAVSAEAALRHDAQALEPVPQSPDTLPPAESR